MTRHLKTIARDRISLSPDEENLFECLDAFVAQVRQAEPERGRLEARIAGGWVRDKLLQQECYDCDVAIADMKGLDFATRFVPFYQHYFHLPPDKIKIAEIKANPEQSKHLDTATVALHARDGGIKRMDLDFVQLRSEEYGEGSRIPTEVRFGTPLDDALRRDLTINALFYNVHTREIEDHTDKGLADLLETPLIRTPLHPRQTFLDDPLRILRCIRFAVRLGYPLDDEILAAVRDDDVRHALAHKVSRERIGIEVKKMLATDKASQALDTIVDLGIYGIVFAPAPGCRPSDADPPLAVRAVRTLSSMRKRQGSFAHLPVEIVDSLRSQFDLNLAACLVPYRRSTYRDRKGKVVSVPRFVANESLKLGNEHADYVAKLFEATDTFDRQSLPKLFGPDEAADLGLMLPRISAEKGPTWQASILFSLLLESLLVAADGEHATLVDEYRALVDRILRLGLDTRAFARPMLTGHDAQTDGVTGPDIKRYLDHVRRWQLLHPAGSRDECKAYMHDWIASRRVEGRDVKKLKAG